MSDTVQPMTATGQPPRLRRGLKVIGALLITLSAITPASSVFIIAPGVMAQAGTGAVWSFLAAGVVGVFMAFVYAELASAYPLTGGEYAIVGRTLGRLPGFMIMAMILFTQVIIVAVIALYGPRVPGRGMPSERKRGLPAGVAQVMCPPAGIRWPSPRRP